jgi:hypothetical protein
VRSDKNVKPKNDHNQAQPDKEQLKLKVMVQKVTEHLVNGFESSTNWLAAG